MRRIKVECVGGELLPIRAYDSKGFDLRARSECVIYPSTLGVIPVGIKTDFDRDLVAIVKDKSGNAAKLLHVIGGVIDPDYRGEWKVMLVNLSKFTVTIEPGTKVAQVLFLKAPRVQWEQASLSISWRGDRGFGSSGGTIKGIE